jgi:DNA repair protein RadC
MKYVLKEMTMEELPREKLKKFGANNLSDYELLAIILKTGTKDKSVIDLSIELLDYIKRIEYFNEITLNELLCFKGIGEAKALSLIASIEFANRLLSGEKKEIILKKTSDIYNYIKYEMVNLVQEKMVCIYVNIKLKVIYKSIINVGSLSRTEIDIKTCIKWGIKLSCYAICFIHNHPSGDARPSMEDEFVTKKIIDALQVVDIVFMDHLIIGRSEYYSFKAKSLIKVNN